MGLKSYTPEVSIINDSKHRVFFRSTNESTDNEVIKIVEYEKYEGLAFQNKAVFNLGFGDYDIEKDDLIDTSLTGNDDQYLVFNTVLNTVPKFFETTPNAVIFIMGSDSSDAFAQNCIKDCPKKRSCDTQCKKQNQRIRTYCGYISRHYETLTKIYDFKGAYIDEHGNISEVRTFEKRSVYDCIFVIKIK
jgi:hypothetical protein